MKLSVCLITYNQEQFIGDCVRSVLAQQTNFPFEIVIGEDASTDRTRAILEDLDREHPGRMRLMLRPQNIGMLPNFAQTLAACEGEYVAVLEGDDVWTDPQKLQLQADFLDSHPECSFCFHAVDYVYDDGRPSQRVPGHLPEIMTLHDLIPRNFIQTCSIMARRALLSTVPPWVLGLRLGDWPMCIVLASKGDIGFIDRVMAMYRAHSTGSWTGETRLFRARETIRMYQTLQDRLGLDCAEPIAREHVIEAPALAVDAEREGRRADARKHMLRAVELLMELEDKHERVGQTLMDATDMAVNEYMLSVKGPRPEMGVSIRKDLELVNLRRQLQAIQQSRGWRTFERITRLPGMGAVSRLARRFIPE